MSKFHEYKWNNSESQSRCLETPKNKLHVRQRRVESTAATPQEPQQLAGELLRWRLLQGTAAAVQVDTSQLEVVIGGEVLEEVALGLCGAVGLITFGLAGAPRPACATMSCHTCSEVATDFFRARLSGTLNRKSKAYSSRKHYGSVLLRAKIERSID